MMYAASHALASLRDPADTVPSTMPPTVTLGDLQATVRLRLSGSLRNYMKPNDITYAQKLLTKTSVTTAERRWLQQFVVWYDPYNLDAVRRYAEEHGITGTAVDRVKGALATTRSTVAANVRAAAKPPVGPEAAADADESSPPMTTAASMGALGVVGLIGMAAVAGIAAYAVTKVST